eukprot:1220630-Pleurochrysis_carterae.AAC.2
MFSWRAARGSLKPRALQGLHRGGAAIHFRGCDPCLSSQPPPLHDRESSRYGSKYIYTASLKPRFVTAATAKLVHRHREARTALRAARRLSSCSSCLTTLHSSAVFSREQAQCGAILQQETYRPAGLQLTICLSHKQISAALINTNRAVHGGIGVLQKHAFE